MTDSIAHIVFIAGPSAAGKSTFIRQLTSGALPDEIRAQMPAGAAGWPVLDGNDILKRGQNLRSVVRDAYASGGAIVHYDIVHVDRVGFAGGYAGDPLFEIFDLAAQVTLVNLRPQQAQLLRQFEERLREQQRRKGWLRTFWRNAVHARLREARLRMKGTPQLDKHRLYVDEAWLKACYARWDAFVAAALGRKLTAVIEVTRDSSADIPPSFRLRARSPGRSRP